LLKNKTREVVIIGVNARPFNPVIISAASAASNGSNNTSNNKVTSLNVNYILNEKRNYVNSG
jgi:hypothetical protein